MKVSHMGAIEDGGAASLSRHFREDPSTLVADHM